MKNTVHLGFIAIIFIMTMLAFVWLGYIKKSNENVLDLTELYDAKIQHAHTMSNATRFRQISLLSMVVIKDPFVLDNEISKFYELALPYRLAREVLFSMPMSDEEKIIHQLLDKQTQISQPLSTRAVEMFRNRESKEKIVELINTSMASQEKLFKAIDHFVALQRKSKNDAKNYSRKQFDDSVFLISIIGFIAIIISVLISRYVGKAVADKNKQLFDAGTEMTIFYQKAEEATLHKSEFLATMSHEIRTPLTAIIGFAETTLFSEQTMEQRQNAVQTIIRSGKHLLQIINDILDLSKVEANKLEMEQVTFSLFELLAYIENLIRPAAEDKGLGFSINYLFPLPDKITSDPLRIKQVLINLCNNAIKFTDQGYVLINVSCTCDGDNSQLSFEVVDSGIGMTEEQLTLIFQAYRQADASTTRKYGGTGLGLSLSRLLAEQLGGTLSVQSQINKGSQFRFTLDTALQRDPGIVFSLSGIPENKKDKIEAVTTLLSGHILLAEDNKDNQALLSIYLNRMGLEVTVVENGERAVEAVKNNYFDLVLMDMRMPVMGGIEAVEILRKNNFTIPIVALTANAMQEDKNACFNAGCDGFLTKPVDMLKLRETLQGFLNVKEVDDNKPSFLLSSLLEDEPDSIDLIKRYVHKLPDTLKEIKHFIETREWEKLSEILHQLKGTGGNFGYPAVSALAGKMEFQAVNKNSGELIKLLSELTQTQQQILSGIEMV